MSESKNTSIVALDGLRGLSCLLVLLAHSSQIKLLPYLPYAGICGVRLFFALSGFLMGYHYFPGAPSLRYWGAFMTRRIFRVYPAFALAMITIWMLHLCGTDVPLYWNFDTDRLMKLLTLQIVAPTYWSIPLEIKFYAVFPLIALALFPLRGKPAAAIAIMTITCLVLLVTIDDPRSNLTLWEKLPCFLGGLCAALALRLPLDKLPVNVWNVALLACLALLLLMALPNDVLPGAMFREDRIRSFLPVPLILCAVMASGKAQYILSNRVMVTMGILSYSIYVTHRIVFGLFALYWTMDLWLSVTAVVVEFAVATAVYMAVEMPCNKLGRRLSGRLNPAP